MNDFLAAIKADLLDRRLLPFVVLAVAALVGALAYLALGGNGGGSGTETPLQVPPSLRASGLPVSAQPPADKSPAETISGAPKQRGGLARDPFIPLAGTAVTGTSTTSTAPSKTSTESSGSSSRESKSSVGGSSPSSTTPKEAPAPKPRTEYSVAVLMGPAPSGTPPQSANLTPYEKLKFHQKLPSPELRLLTFTGAASNGKRATFKLVGEAILRGPAVCQPSASQCEAIALAVGQTEELEYLPASGSPVTYELQVTSINAEKH
jgi:hypothetical protein